MESLLIFVSLLACVLIPMVVFAVVGYKAMNELAKRPLRGGRVMIAMIFKLVVTAAILIALLMFVLEFFG